MLSFKLTNSTSFCVNSETIDMLSNLFDYAYHRGYIAYQPLLLFDISKL